MDAWQKLLKDPETTWIDVCLFYDYLSSLSKEDREKVLNEE
jgi:hypothetical protein